MDSVIFDTRWVEPHAVVGAGGWSVAVLCPQSRHTSPCRVHPDIATTAMLPDPGRNIDAITVTKGVNDRSDPRQIMAARCETVPPTVPTRRSAYHRRAVSLVGVRPLFAQFTKFDDASAVVVIGHPARDLISRDSRNIHGVSRGRVAVRQS